MARAASIKDVKFSQQGELTQDSPFENPTLSNLMVSNTVAPSSGRAIFKLVDISKKGRVWVDGISDVVNPKTHEPDRLRLLRGVGKIWQSEQEKVDSKYVDKNRRSLMFENQICVISASDKTGLDFARLNENLVGGVNFRPGTKHAYYEWNPAKQEAEALEREMLENEVVQLAMAQTYEQVKKHAAYLGGISFVDELGEPRTEQGVRTLYIRRAKADPKRFKSSIDSKEVEINWLIKKAILDSKIDIGGKTGIIKWANGGEICRLPQGRNALEYLLEFASLPQDESKRFVGDLQKTIL